MNFQSTKLWFMEKLVFEPSGLIKDPFDLEELEFWGHDSGEFVPQKINTDPEIDSSNKDQNLEPEEPVQRP